MPRILQFLHALTTTFFTTKLYAISLNYVLYSVLEFLGLHMQVTVGFLKVLMFHRVLESSIGD